MPDLTWIEKLANACEYVGKKIANRYRKRRPWSPDYTKKRFLSDLVWKVIEKVADEATLHLVRDTFEVAHIKLVRQIMKETGKLELSLLIEMSDQLSERIFQSIASDSFHMASELHLFTILFYPDTYPRIVKEFKYHLENPIPPDPTKTEIFLSFIYEKLKTTLFDSESLYSDENCLADTRTIASERRRSLLGDIDIFKRGTEEERHKMVNLVLWKLICKASYRSVTQYKLKHTVPVYKRLSVILWEELKDLDFLIFYHMDKKLGKDIFQLLSGNEDVVRDKLFYLMRMDHPIVDYKLICCFKKVFTHPRKVNLPESTLTIAFKDTKSAVCKMFCRRIKVHPIPKSIEYEESVDEGEGAIEPPSTPRSSADVGSLDYHQHFLDLGGSEYFQQSFIKGGLKSRRHSFDVESLESRRHSFDVGGLESRRQSFDVGGLKSRRHSFDVESLESRRHSFDVGGLESRRQSFDVGGLESRRQSFDVGGLESRRQSFDVGSLESRRHSVNVENLVIHTDFTHCDLVSEEDESVEPEDQGATELAVSEDETPELTRKTYTEFQQSSMTPVECFTQTSVKSVVSKMSYKVYSDQTVETAQCHPAFIQVHPYNPVSKNKNSEQPERQQPNKYLTNVDV